MRDTLAGMGLIIDVWCQRHPAFGVKVPPSALNLTTYLVQDLIGD